MEKLVDMELALEACGGYEDIFESVLEVFLIEINEFPEEIDELYRRKDWKNYRVRIHGMKNSAATVGAMRLSVLSKKLEMAALQEEIDIIDESMDSLYQLVEETKKWFMDNRKGNSND